MSERRKIHIISLGTSLSIHLKLQPLVQSADHLFGDQQQINAIKNHISPHTKIHPYPKVFDKLAQQLPKIGIIICLASGDGLFFSVGNILTQALKDEPLCVHPSLSSLQSACSRLHWPWQNVKTVSLHGRPLYTLKASLHTNQQLCILTDKNNTPQKIAQLLQNVGLGQSHLWVFEKLDQPKQATYHYPNTPLPGDYTFQTPNVVLIKTTGESFLPIFPGIDDKHWILKNKQKCFSKKTTRLHILAAFQTQPNTTGWDIGAGYGALTLEWARWHPTTKIYAIEKCKQTFEVFQKNQAKFGDHNNIECHNQNITQIIDQLPNPHYIVIGGSQNDELETLLNQCAHRLQIGGKMIIIAATENTKYTLWQCREKIAKDWQTENICFQTYQETQLGEKQAFKPNMQIQISVWQKPATSLA